MKSLLRAFWTAFIGCGALALLTVLVMFIAMARIFNYNFLLDALVVGIAFIACWGTGKLVQGFFAKAK